jgi:hypothetical protein
MNLFDLQFAGFLLVSSISSATAQPGTPEVSRAPPPISTISGLSFITKIWSTTETYVNYPGFVGPTILSSITTSTVSTIEPVVTSYPATVLDTVISSVTWEYQYYYSDGTNLTSITSGVYTKPLVTAVLSTAP